MHLQEKKKEANDDGVLYACKKTAIHDLLFLTAPLNWCNKLEWEKIYFSL